MKTGILFDLDGTLLDTLEDICDGVNYALAALRRPRRTIGEVRAFVGNGARDLLRDSLSAEADDPLVDTALAAFQEYYQLHSQDKTRPYPGILEALTQIAARYPVGIVSNKPDWAVKGLCADYFPGIYARGESASCPRKPAPDMVLQAMQAIGVERCIYVGDSQVDIATAKNAGVPCLSVLWGFRDRAALEAAGGTRFCETTGALLPTLEEIMNTEGYYGK